MAWNQCLYQYCKARGGQYLGGREDDGLLPGQAAKAFRSSRLPRTSLVKLWLSERISRFFVTSGKLFDR